MKINKDQLASIRKSLPRGSYVKIAEKVGKSVGHCRNVLHGACFNADVIQAAINLAREHQEKMDSIQDQLEEIGG